jgi:predicted metal-dependent phosphoesterase TrpH
VLKVELHAHTSDDPLDAIAHTTRQLIDRAAARGYGALAITLHNRYFDPAPDATYAAERGLVLIAGIERTIERRHVLLLNFPSDCAAVQTFDELARLRRRHPRGLVVVPHAFYPTGTAMRPVLDRYAHLVDAVEVNAMFTAWVDFNRRARAWAREHGKPVVGNTDLHLLDQLGSTYTLVDAAPDADAICDAIRAGRVQVHAGALPAVRAGWVFGRMLLRGLIGRARGLVPAAPRRPPRP